MIFVTTQLNIIAVTCGCFKSDSNEFRKREESSEEDVEDGDGCG